MKPIGLILLMVFSVAARAQTGSRAELYRALREAKIVHPERELTHFSHTCSLRIEGGEYPVVDLQELVKGASTPRGVNRIIVLNSSLKAVRQIDYTSQRPLFCIENRLYVYGDLEIGNVAPEGNVLTFSQRGQTVKLSHTEANDYPIPLTRDRGSPPQ